MSLNSCNSRFRYARSSAPLRAQKEDGERMEPERINSTELRTKTRDLMERVKYHGDRFVVETFGRPMAVIISIEDFHLAQAALCGPLKNVAPVMSLTHRRTAKKGRRKKESTQKSFKGQEQ